MGRKKDRRPRLTDILVRLGACEQEITRARAWLRDSRFETFAEAWAACRSADWMETTVHLAANSCGLSTYAFLGPCGDLWCSARTPDAIRRAVPAHIIERALYDYARREGMA